jgi:NEDD8-activating enzyme E1 regulatory subunit
MQRSCHVQEALRYAHTAFTELKVPEHVEKLMDDEQCTNLSGSSSDFWILLAAVKRFVVCCKPLSQFLLHQAILT